MILIKVEVKYDHSFDPNFDARQIVCQKCYGFAYTLILDKEEGKCDLNFDSNFDACQRRNQISYEFAMHLISVRGEVKHVNNFDSSFNASKAFKDTTTLHTFDDFDLLCQRRSKTS